MARKKPKPFVPPRFARAKRWGFWLVLLGCLVGVSWRAIALQPAKAASDPLTILTKTAVTKELNKLSIQALAFEGQEATANLQIIDNSQIQQDLKTAQLSLAVGDLKAARQAVFTLKSDLAVWKDNLTSLQKKQADNLALVAVKAATISVPIVRVPYGKNIPILIYHYTPSDFENQLEYLQNHDYTTITLADVTAAINNAETLPDKPVVITFDDGYEDQMNAFSLLQKYSMKATFFIIDGGPESNYCIGANRTNYTCGDATLSWDQIRMLDQSGLITIGSHTINHPELSTETEAEQRYEIIDGKTQLEAQLGHPVYDFAYPYGNYNATTVSLVKEAGFRDAVSTNPGTYQSLNNLYALARIRNVYQLP